MWMIASRLKAWQARTAISEGEPGITKVRMFSGQLPEETEGTLFAGPASDVFADPLYDNTVMLIYRRDMIFVADQSPEDVLNEALAALDFFNSWEQAVLRAAEGEEPFRRIIDLSDPVLDNPMMLVMLDGSLIAWSKRYEQARFGSSWDYIMEHKTFPSFADFEGFITPAGNMVKDWNSVPQEYYLKPQGEHLFGFYLTVDGEPVATFTLGEHNRPFEPCDVQCLNILSGVFSHIAATRKQSPIRPNVAVLESLLDGQEPEKPLLNQLGKAAAPPPWVLIVFRAFEGINTRVLRVSLERRLRQFTGVSFALDYHGTIAAICAQEQRAAFEGELKKQRLHEHWQIGVTLPFSRWTNLPFRYRQALFAIEQGLADKQETNGLRHCKDYAFEQILSVMSQDASVRELLHPAVTVLERYDAEHNTALGETLRRYLEHERNTTLTAKILNLHRNTLLHRMERIASLVDANLDDPAERSYIHFSYLIKNTQQ
jgi:hypothetical protein